MISSIYIFFKEFNVENNVHWILMFLCIIGICIAFYGKHKAQEYVKNNINLELIINDTLVVKKVTL